MSLPLFIALTVIAIFVLLLAISIVIISGRSERSQEKMRWKMFHKK